MCELSGAHRPTWDVESRQRSTEEECVVFKFVDMEGESYEALHYFSLATASTHDM
jgi:hypothetical protein